MKDIPDRIAALKKKKKQPLIYHRVNCSIEFASMNVQVNKILILDAFVLENIMR